MAYILVIDDDQDVRDCIERVLISAGFEVRTAAEGRLAMEELAREPADVVVVDLMMPRLNGVEVIQEIRNRFPRVLIIAITGGAAFAQTLSIAALDQPGMDVLLASQVGAEALLMKPFDLQELLVTVQQLLDGQHLTT
jgi:DNA-binding response OmpR family regulator